MSWHKISDYVPSASQVNSTQDNAMAENANNSDASTVEDGNNEGDFLGDTDQYAYLQGLNSDNLMQFSQQSALQELMLTQLDVKPNLNVLPTFEEHDIGGYKFQLNLSTMPQRKKNSNWVYSKDLNKIYIQMNKIFSIDAIYTPKSPQMPLRIRAMICFRKEVSEPVVRCQNHISMDAESHPNKRHSLLRCENPSAEYRGTWEGKSINDRFSVLVPLNVNSNANAEGIVKQTVAMKFTCQNSCIGRRETSIIFLLEGMNGEILSQRVLDVKICSCPKRDKSSDERNLTTPRKHKSSEDLYPRSAKILRQSSTSPAMIKREHDSDSDIDDNDIDSNDASEQKQYDIQRTPGGGYRIVMELCNKDVAMRVLENAYTVVGASIIMEPSHAKRSKKNFDKLKRLHDKASKM